MQYPVPQFTDVEDKIIGSLTVRQFGIIFAAGVLVFLVYTVTKSIPVLIIFAIIIGIPALAIAFAKVNGRPMYKMFPYILNFLTRPRVLVFHKDAQNFSGDEKVKNIEVVVPIEKKISKETAQSRIKEVNAILQQKAQEEKDLLKQLK
jgi:hypothetical protein